MNPKPPPRTLQPAEERKIQIFLDRASSIVLDCPVLDLAHWQRLVTLAEELGLTEEELRGTVNDLRQRGVISEIDLGPPKPPPLPSQAGKPRSGAASHTRSEQEQDFSLSPPVPPPPPPKPPNGRPAELSHEQRVLRYVERAQAIIAQQRGFGARTQALLAAAADELGLSEQEAADALQPRDREPTLPPPPPSAVAKPGGKKSVNDAGPDETLRDHRRWRVEGVPPPEPPPPTRKPEAVYRDYLSASLAQITDGVVPALLKRKFIKHGTSVLGLAITFARHIVSEEAAEKGLRFESDRQDADAGATTTDVDPADNTADGTNVKRFLERSVSILARHRGINAKSRVLLNALAAELGLSDEQAERAIAATQFRVSTAGEDADALQQERLVGFRELVQGALVSLPRKLLTFDIEENLCRHGQERHGLKPELVTNTIREVCVALDIRQISEQQARAHIEHLVDVKLGESTRLADDVRSRLESEGKQWGLSTGQIAAVIQERTRLQEKRHRAERNFTLGALVAASVAALIVVGFFGWVVIRDNAPRLEPIEVTAERPRAPDAMVIDESKVDTAWWGEELEFAIGAARRQMASQRPELIRIESQEPDVRSAAYGQLVDHLFAAAREEEQRELLSQVLAMCYARDPDQPAARQLLDSIITRIPQSERDLRDNAESHAQAFLATQATIALIAPSTDERQREAATELGRAIGRTIDADLEPATLRQHAYEGVAERLYRLLIALARSDPASVASAHTLVADRTAARVDAAKLEKLNTDFLVVALSGAKDAWREYKPLIRETVASKSPLNAIRMLEIYETTEDLELQAFLADSFLERIDETPDSREVATIAQAVRKSLGVAAEVAENKRLTRFLVGADILLAEPRADISQPEMLLAEIVNLAYYSTLGGAVARGSAGDTTFDTLAERDPAAFLTPEESIVPLGRDETTSLEPTTLRMLNDRLRMLLNPRTSPVTRSGFVESMAGLTDRVDDLAPDQAAQLATYLLGKKRVEEHRVILPYVEKLGAWKQVRLAVADQLEDVGVNREWLQEIVSRLLRREYNIGDGDAGREALRVELLRDVLVDAKKEDIGAQQKYQVYDDARQALFDLVKAQALLFHASEWTGEPVTRTAVLQTLIDARVKELLAATPSAETKKQVQRIEVDARAIDYLATNDLQKLALLDRAWLRLLAVDFARKHPLRKAEAESLLEQLAARDRDAEHVLLQLRDGQETILRLWLLLNRTN